MPKAGFNGERSKKRKRKGRRGRRRAKLGGGEGKVFCDIVDFFFLNPPYRFGGCGGIFFSSPSFLLSLEKKRKEKIE